ncbi:hypothetical protein GDO86_010872 [Hymenochirus boettgeri]|uniref:Nibrin n=1 Tax=Hymenochirus boettgeri TaxID=247094 RepID=A0A8T2JE11_9PIPI|nr:hypothetical protein GDO86_010872 [Hymenochirus boettgeri]
MIPVLTIKDSSKYGTFVNEAKIESSAPRSLKTGDKVTFGVFNSKYRVENDPLIICSSCLDSSEKNSLNQALLLLGGHVLNNWTETCTHLVMTSIKVTIKTICALICCKPIVKPDYFNELAKAILEKKTLPEYSSFIPPLDEPSLKSQSLDLSRNVRRKSIFKDKIFLFLNVKQYKKLSPAVLFGGGKANLITEELKDKSILENPFTCVVDVAMTESQLSESQSSQPWIAAILDILQSKGLRAIPEAEIGLAVIVVSTEIHCNPRRQMENGNNSGTATRNNILCSTLSQSVAVDETVLPASTLNMTAYVANTEPQDQPSTCMNISGIREVKETPKSLSRSNRSMNCTANDLEMGGANDVRHALFQEEKTENQEDVPQFLSIKPLSRNMEKTNPKPQPSKKIDCYFQPMAKKRGREEDENEESSFKASSVSFQCTKEQLQTDTESQEGHKGHNLSQDMEQLLCDDSGGMIALSKDTTLKKRKEPDVDIVDESDLDSDGDVSGSKDHHSDPKMKGNKEKRRKIDSGVEEEKDCNIKSQETEISTLSKPCTVNMAVCVKMEPDLKNEPVSLREPTQFVTEFKEECDDLPRKLLLTEFKSLIVSRPIRNTQFNGSGGNTTNFKKFRKIAYPGAGSFPHIIGGSDLIPHDKKKNAELEQWLRQEVEEQSQQAREEALAEDLFSYNPKSIKKRK